MKKLASFWIISLLSFISFAQIAPYALKVEPIKVNEKVSLTGELLTLSNQKIPFSQLIEGKKTLLIFYRGGWCPFCNRHLAELRNIVDSLNSKGVQLIAISPEKPKDMVNTMEKNDISYQLYSDFSSQIMKNFGIAFQQNKKDVLPVPAVFLVDEQGKILFVHYDPDYKQRLSNEKILEAIK